MQKGTPQFLLLKKAIIIKLIYFFYFSYFFWPQNHIEKGIKIFLLKNPAIFNFLRIVGLDLISTHVTNAGLKTFRFIIKIQQIKTRVRAYFFSIFVVWERLFVVKDKMNALTSYPLLVVPSEFFLWSKRLLRPI